MMQNEGLVIPENDTEVFLAFTEYASLEAW